jgi:uncharacterized phiE125 gp8 family phage protein
MALRRTTPPAVDPVTLDEAKAHLIVTHDEDDDLIGRLVMGATRLLELETARQFVEAEWLLSLDGFEPVIELRVCPVIEITELAYVDAAGVQQTLDPAAYQLDAESCPARLAPAFETEWPDTRAVMNAVQVTFTAGYGDAEELDLVPAEAKQAILLLVGHWYEHRETVALGTISTEIEAAYRSLADGLRWSLI